MFNTYLLNKIHGIIIRVSGSIKLALYGQPYLYTAVIFRFHHADRFIHGDRHLGKFETPRAPEPKSRPDLSAAYYPI
jgi:hypothetical protein